MRVGVVVPFHGEWGCVSRLVGSIRQQSTRPDEVVFVIDGGEPGDVTKLTLAVGDDAPDLSLRVLQQSWAGGAAARNRGVAATTTAIVVFLEADGEYSSNYLERVVAALSNSVLGVGAVSPELRIALTEHQGWVARYQRARWEGIRSLTRAHRRQVLGGWGFRRDVFERVGGYDEHLLVGEDRALVERVRALGMEVRVARRTFFSHPEPSSPAALWRKAFTRARQASPFYAEYRPLLLAGLRLAGGAGFLAALAIGVAAFSSQSAWPLVAVSGAAGTMLGILVATAWCDRVVVAAARRDRRANGGGLARVVFAGLRALEQIAAFSGGVLGALATMGARPMPRKKFGGA